MVPLTALWLPILVSAVIVVVANSIIHLASPWHKSDYPKVPNEGRVMDTLQVFPLTDRHGGPSRFQAGYRPQFVCSTLVGATVPRMTCQSRDLT